MVRMIIKEFALFYLIFTTNVKSKSTICIVITQPRSSFIGYARDGGLYFPESIPTITRDDMEKWSKLSYPELVRKILPLFISEDEMPRADLNEIVDSAFKKFSGQFSL